jgi:hypothetical protein
MLQLCRCIVVFIIFSGASVSKIWKAKVKIAMTLRNTILNNGKL